MAELGRKEAEQLIKEILTEYARKIRSAKKKEYTADVQPLFSPDIDAFYKLVKSEDVDFYIFNRLNDEGIRQLLVGCRRLAKCYELGSYGKIKDFTYEPETSKCRIASDSDGKYSAGGSYTFTLDGKEKLGKKWYEPYSVVWHFYKENPVTRKYEEVVSAMSEARAFADFNTWDRSFIIPCDGNYKVTATIFNQALSTGIRPDIVEVCELYFEAEERNIADLSYSDKIRIAIEYSNVSNEILEEIGDLNKLAIQLAGIFLLMAVLTASGLGTVAEALGIVLLVTNAAISGTQLLSGLIELKDFLSKVNDAKTEDDLKACGKIFGDAVAKIGVDGLFFVLSIFGLKKASAKLTTRTVVDNGLNSKKWVGKKIEEKNLKVGDEKAKSVYLPITSKPPLQFNESNCHDHLIYGDGIKSGQGGVNGAHNKINFYKTINDKFEPIFRKEGLTFNVNDCIESSTAHPKISGVEEIKYKLPAMNQNNTVNQGVYKKIKAPKTVYDSSIISDEQMLQWGKEAMQNGIDNGNIREGRYISGTASNGLRFEGYIDSTTNTITNFHPILD